MLLVVACALTRSSAPRLQPVACRALARSVVVAAELAGRAANGATTVELPSVVEAQALGARIASVARAGDVVLLDGAYGAGKTCLARGFVRGWYNDPTELVTSPSYLIDNLYDDDGRARVPGVAVHHMDLWRLDEGKVAQLVDLPRVFYECVSLIEWPERLGAEHTPAEHLRVTLDFAEADGGADGRAARAGSADEEADAGWDEDEDQPRVATLKAVGRQWEARLEWLETGLMEETGSARRADAR